MFPGTQEHATFKYVPDSRGHTNSHTGFPDSEGSQSFQFPCRFWFGWYHDKPAQGWYMWWAI